jgi:VWFA-related protein
MDRAMTNTRQLISHLCLLPFIVAIVAAQTQTPVFRGGTDLVELDVSVLDKNRQPVHGLRQEDFTILEDGNPQTLAAFSAVDLPEVTRPVTKWMDEVSPDVTTNQIDNRRIFVLVLDDGLMPTDQWANQAMRRSALSVIDRMSYDDLAAVIFTRDNRGAQDLTNDRVKLRRAVGTLSQLGTIPTPGVPRTAGMAANFDFPPCTAYTNSIGVVQQAAEYLASLPRRRKTLIYLAAGMAVDIGAGMVRGPLLPREDARACGGEVVALMKDGLRSAQRGNVSIYGLDPMGLRPGAFLGSAGGVAIEFLQSVSDNTGGHAIFNTNDFEPGLEQIFRENSSYYLLGYRPTNAKADGTIRRLDVKVNRPDVEVRTRKNYVAPAPPGAKRVSIPPNLAAIADIAPKTDLPMQITMAPFAGAGQVQPSVAIVLGMQRPAQSERVVEELELVVRAFTPEGDARGSADQPITLNIPPARRGEDVTRYDLLTQLSLKPGRYRMRVSAHDTTLDKLGSVYADVDVPDFAKQPLTLSGAALTVVPGLPVAPPEALAEILPIVPTAAREFARHDRVTAFLRAYEGGTTPIVPVSIAIRVIDAQDKVIVDSTETIGVDRFKDTRAADVRYQVPVAQLAPGDYLLTFEAALDATTARRDVRFRVK